jgi:hypothetical protein
MVKSMAKKKNLDDTDIGFIVDELTWRENRNNSKILGFKSTLQNICQKKNLSNSDCERVKQAAIKRSHAIGNADLTLFGGYIE